jgi:hypothetical protein
MQRDVVADSANRCKTRPVRVAATANELAATNDNRPMLNLE